MLVTEKHFEAISAAQVGLENTFACEASPALRQALIIISPIYKKRIENLPKFGKQNTQRPSCLVLKDFVFSVPLLNGLIFNLEIQNKHRSYGTIKFL